LGVLEHSDLHLQLLVLVCLSSVEFGHLRKLFNKLSAVLREDIDLSGEFAMNEFKLIFFLFHPITLLSLEIQLSYSTVK